MSLPRMDGKRRGAGHRYRLGDAMDDFARLLRRAKRHLSAEEFDELVSHLHDTIQDEVDALRERHT